jgi:hypothetical protein
LDNGLPVYRWRRDTGVVIVPDLADAEPISGRDGDLLFRDPKSNQYRIYSPQQRQTTTLPLDPKIAQVLGWDSIGRLIISVDDRNCGRTIQAVATGSDSGTDLMPGGYNVTLAPTGDALVAQDSGLTVVPLTPTGPAGYVANVSNYSWQGSRSLLVSESRGGWWQVDLKTGNRQAITGAPDGRLYLAPDGLRSATVTPKGIVIRDTTGDRIVTTIGLDNLPTD